jgi:hypothetical protein
MKYYVITKFYDSGKVVAGIVLESEYAGEQNESNSRYDQYVDEFDSYEKAAAFVEEAKHC